MKILVLADFSREVASVRWWYCLFLAAWYIGYSIRSAKNRRVYGNITVPQQLIRLVQQAQAGESFETEFNIGVGAVMGEKLCYPLTPEQVELIRATPYYDCQWKKFSYRLCEFKKDGKELSGVVLSTIHFQDNSRNINLDYKDVPLRLRCTNRLTKGYRLDSVERL